MDVCPHTDCELHFNSKHKRNSKCNTGNNSRCSVLVEVFIPRRILRGKHCLTVAWVAADLRQVYSRHASPAPHCSAPSAPAPSAPHSPPLKRSPHRAQRSGSAEAGAVVLLSRDVRDAVVVVVVVFTLAVVCIRVRLRGCGDPGSGRGSAGPR